jgi:hypothetical protein
MHLSFTTFNPTQPAGWVANPVTGTRAGQLSRACIGIMYLLLMGVAAQAQTTWTGTAGTDWNTAGNWDPAGVPTAAIDVAIPIVGNSPQIEAGTAAVANSVHVRSGAALTIGSGGSLTINGSKTISDVITAFYNQGTVNNSGQLVIGNVATVGNYGLYNQNGTVNNNLGGTIRIDQSTLTGLYIGNGFFTNAGAIIIGGTAAVGEFGLYNFLSTFSNSREARLRLTGQPTPAWSIIWAPSPMRGPLPPAKRPR